MFDASIYFPEAPGGRSVTWAATGRSGGVSAPPYDSLNLAFHVGDDPAAVAANRERVAEVVGAHGLASFEAVHGGQCRYVDAPGIVPDVDAIWTDVPGLALLAMGADCAVIALMGDRTVCAVHCGWQGLVADVIGESVRQLQDVDVIRRIVIGPAICGACYPIPQERADSVMASHAGGPGVVVRTPDGQPGIDVRAGVRTRLRSLGIADELIESVPGCTREDANLFSVRRDSRTGRQGIVVVLAGRGEHDGALDGEVGA